MRFVIDGFKPKPKSKPGTASTASNPGNAASASGQKCKVGDWSCRVKAATPEVKCGGAGKARSCNSIGPAGIWSYSYRFDHLIGTTKQFSAEQAMTAFSQNPTKVFPFTVEGCPTFKNGGECSLKTGTPLLNPNGVVGVTTTRTSVKFTVLDYGYFDAPGSTIKFSTWEDKKGNVYLTQTADGHGADFITYASLSWFEAAKPTWEQQASNLSALMEESR